MSAAAVTPRREARIAWTVFAAFAAFLVVMAAISVPQLDDWYEVAWLRVHDFGLAAVARFAGYNYMNYNPRFGETALLVTNGPRVIHAIWTPVMQLALLAVVFAIAHGAWPRATLRDLGRLVVLQAVIWLVIPIPGVMYFYRPYAANYLFASCIQLGLLVPYRLALVPGAAPGAPRRWLVPVMLAWGFVAGFANEHTGPTAMLALFAFALAAWARKRLPAWMVAGAIGHAIGYAMLVLAPGQRVRYAGIPGGGVNPVHTLLARGVGGNLGLVGDVVLEIAPGVLLVGAFVLAAVRNHGAAAIPRDVARRALVLLAGALTIVATAFASPIAEDRVWFAPCLLVAAALVVLADVPAIARRARSALLGACAAVVVVHALGFAITYAQIHARVTDRIAALEDAPPKGRVILHAQVGGLRDHWQYGEDLATAYMRDLLAHRVYDLESVELADAPAWSQPNLPESARVAVALDPPVPPDQAPVVLPPDTPQWAWVLRALREAWPAISGVPGHALHDIEVTVTPAVPLPGGRPIELVTWRAGKYAVIDLKASRDPLGWSFVRAPLRDLPLDPTEAYVEACGSSWRVELAREAGDLRVPVHYHCAGIHTIYLCDARTCWLAGRYW